MKKIFLFFALFITVAAANAQILRAEELEKYAKEKFGDKWVDAASSLASQLSLDKNNALTCVQVIEAPEKSKDQLYVLLNYWFNSTFNDASSVINLNDKDLGTIIAQGYIEGIAAHAGGMNRYVVSIKPIIKCDIKEGRVRVTYTIPFYSVVKLTGGGIMGALGSSTPPTKSEENWTLDSCYPFAQKDSHKKASCKALIMAHAYSNVVMDKIEECLKHGISGNEGDDW